MRANQKFKSVNVYLLVYSQQKHMTFRAQHNETHREYSNNSAIDEDVFKSFNITDKDAADKGSNALITKKREMNRFTLWLAASS